MFTAENCPYIVVGVPAYAPKSEASVGFALASRRVKASADSPFTIQDLTAALSRLESGDVGQQLVYAIPTEYHLFTRPLPSLSGFEGLPSLDELEKLADGEVHDREREVLALLLLRAGLDHLLKWDWGNADKFLKLCLRVSKNEMVRDEALNLVAATLVMTGDTGRAIQALSKAVEGQWNLRLQANLAILALEEEPARAVEQMSYLVDGARGAEEKLAAIKMAIGLWRQVQEESLGTDDDEQFEPMPDRLLASIVETLLSPDISQEDFFDLGLFLARVSPSSVTRQSLNRSVHKGTAAAEIVFARSCEFSHYVDNVVKLAYADRRRPPCVDSHVNGLVEELCSGMFEDNAGLAPIAFSFLQQGLGVETMHRIWLRAAVVLLLPRVLDEDAGPNEQFAVWLKEAKVASPRIDMPDELRTLTNEMLGDASDVLMRLHLRDFFSLASEVENMANNISQQMGSFWNRLGVDKSDIQSRSQAGFEWCSDQIDIFDRMLDLGLTDPELRKNVRELRDATNSIRTRLLQFI